MNLWKQILLSLLLPVLVASVIAIYAVYNLGTISHKITFIEIADDINLTLLELRRYEKNILLFKEEENIKIFHGYLEQLDGMIHDAENKIFTETNKQHYRSLLKDIRTYKESAYSLISSIKTEQKLLEDIRPLGRTIEKNALHKETALELRRYEKNYIIYGEKQAIDKLLRISKELIINQPSLSVSLSLYLKAFDSFIDNESLKESLVEKMRNSGRAIEKITKDISDKKRAIIDKTISVSRKLFIASFIFLIVSTSVVSGLFSTNIVRTLKRIEQSFGWLKGGDLTKSIEINPNKSPWEIASFVEAYNQTISKLRVSRIELEKTLEKLEDANRELIEKQDELVETRKLTAMRLLASEIAHEINNPLSSVITFLGMFYEDMQADDPKKETIDLMLKEISRCQSVLEELVDFARKESLKLKEANPAKLLKDAIKVASRQNEKSGINLMAFVSELPEKVILDPVLFHQALVNILTNAYQFTSPGGNIEIEGYTDCNNMVIEIKDTGTGISEEQLPYIFEPFFSTRKELGGSGLGLAITKKIIERHHGNIQVESKIGEETVFKIKLPINKMQI